MHEGVTRIDQCWNEVTVAYGRLRGAVIVVAGIIPFVTLSMLPADNVPVVVIGVLISIAIYCLLWMLSKRFKVAKDNFLCELNVLDAEARGRWNSRQSILELVCSRIKLFLTFIVAIEVFGAMCSFWR